MGNQPVEETVWATGVVTLGLCALDFAVEVAGGLLVNVVLIVLLGDLGYATVSLLVTCKWRLSHELDLPHTVLVVHGKLALDLLSDVGHVCGLFVSGGVDRVTGCDVVLIYVTRGADQLSVGV